MGIIYCVCDKATKDFCGKCKKNLILKPDKLLNCSTWKRNITDIER